MKITFISHACLLIETDGITILTDPWWNGPSFAEQWWNYPTPALDRLEGRKIDYIYISHGHHDHLHPETLQTLPRSAVVLGAAECYLADAPRGLGFTVRELRSDEELALTDKVRVRVIPTHGGDSLLAVSDGEQVCINLNDSLHSLAPQLQDMFIERLRALYPRIDYLFCGYAVASHFPNCYRIPGKNREATAKARQRHFTDQWVRIVKGLDPKFAFPFAGDVVILEEDLLWSNEPIHNAIRPPQVLKETHPRFAGRAIDPGPGFEIENGRVVKDVPRPHVSEATMRRDLKSQIERADTSPAVTWSEVEELRGMIETNVASCRSYLESFAGDYHCFVKLRNSTFGISIRKRGADIAVTASRDAKADSADAQLIFSTRVPYLKSSLTVPYGDEIIFVGSGGMFEYRSRADVQRGLHREFAAILRLHETAPVRASDRITLKRRVKRAVYAVLGRDDHDLYDLDHWTVYSDGPGRV